MSSINNSLAAETLFYSGEDADYVFIDSEPDFEAQQNDKTLAVLPGDIDHFDDLSDGDYTAAEQASECPDPIDTTAHSASATKWAMTYLPLIVIVSWSLTQAARIPKTIECMIEVSATGALFCMFAGLTFQRGQLPNADDIIDVMFFSVSMSLYLSYQFGRAGLSRLLSYRELCPAAPTP